MVVEAMPLTVPERWSGEEEEVKGAWWLGS